MADTEYTSLPVISLNVAEDSTPQMRVGLTQTNTITQATDTTLSNENQPADAAAVGERFASVDDTISDVMSDVSDLQDAIDDLIPKSDIETTLTTTGKVADSKATGDAIAAVDGRVDSLSSTVSGLIANALDTTLSVTGKVADAKAAGDAVAAVNTRVDTLSGTVSNLIPNAIDDTLTETGKVADAKATGDAITAVENAVDALDDVCPRRKVITVTVTAGMTVYTVSDAWITADADCYCHDLATVGVTVPVSWVFQAGMVTFTLASALSEDLVFNFGMMKGGVG